MAGKKGRKVGRGAKQRKQRKYNGIPGRCGSSYCKVCQEKEA